MKQLNNWSACFLSDQQQVHRQVRDQARRIEPRIGIQELSRATAFQLKDSAEADSRQCIHDSDQPYDSQPPNHLPPGINKRAPDRLDIANLPIWLLLRQLEGAFAARARRSPAPNIRFAFGKVTVIRRAP